MFDSAFANRQATVLAEAGAGAATSALREQLAAAAAAHEREARQWQAERAALHGCLVAEAGLRVALQQDPTGAWAQMRARFFGSELPAGATPVQSERSMPRCERAILSSALSFATDMNADAEGSTGPIVSAEADELRLCDMPALLAEARRALLHAWVRSAGDLDALVREQADAPSIATALRFALAQMEADDMPISLVQPLLVLLSRLSTRTDERVPGI